VLSWSINQSADANVPWYYYVSVLFEGLSPVIFIFFIIAFLWWLYRLLCGKIVKRELLVLSLCVFMLVIVFIQGRKFPRHLMLVMPWMLLVISDGVVMFVDQLRKYSKFFPPFFLLFIVISASWWGVGKIVLYNQHTVWKDVGAYLQDIVPENSTVYIDGGDYWPLVIHTKYSLKVTSALHAGALKKNDVVIVYDIDMEKPFVMGSPFQNDLFFYSSEYAEQYPLNPAYVQKTASNQPTAKLFYDYVVSHGVVLKDFSYDVHNKVKIVRIVKSGKPPKSDWRPPLNKIVQIVCRLFNEKVFLKAGIEKFSLRLANEVQAKCTRGCVHTCGVF
ncbi:hypothetical protein HY485_02960, partial [Candidatus Woesearchaeota archaeon]|nr:hypothetical protein [Candidatus Woesearchaeota archaeon]